MPGGEIHQLQDNYRIYVPFTPVQDPLADSNFRSMAAQINTFPIDSGFLWLGASGSHASAGNATWTDVHCDGIEFITDGLQVDSTLNRVVCTRSGWFHIDWGIFFGAGAAGQLNSSRILVTNNTPSSPYPSSMEFYAESTPAQRVGGATYIPLGVNDFFEIQGFQQNPTPTTLNLDLENLFMRWSRAYT